MRARTTALLPLVMVTLVGWAGACDDDNRRLPVNTTVGSGGGSSVTVGGPSGSTSSGSTGAGGLEESAIADPDAPCDTSVALDSDDPYDAAGAMGLCKRAADDQDWGLIQARWAMADGSDPVADSDFPLGHGLVTRFGSHVRPLEGERLLALSSGTARDPGQAGYQSVEGFDKGYVSGSPSGFPKESEACAGVVTGATQDDIALEVVMRAPIEAQSLAFNFDFFTYEWPVYVCSPFNDFFVALLEPFPTGQGDGNISFDQLGNPVSVNNAYVRVCDCLNGPPCPAPPTMPLIDYECELGDRDLEGTGFSLHAASGWLVTRAPVTPGSVVKLRFAIYDSADGFLDSTVLLDRFRWLSEATDEPDTRPQ
jgi:hypothetical protein